MLVIIPHEPKGCIQAGKSHLTN